MSTSEIESAACPYCGETQLDGPVVLECPKYGREGCTPCCFPGGRGTMCIGCQEGAVRDDEELI